MARRLDDGRLRSFAPVTLTLAFFQSPCLTATEFVVACGIAHQRQDEVSGNTLIFEGRYPYYSTAFVRFRLHASFQDPK